MTWRIVLMFVAWAFVMCWLSGCATTEMRHTNPQGFSVEWKSRTLWKDIKDAEVLWGDFGATLGNSGSNGNEQLLACLLAPQLPGCQD